MAFTPIDSRVSFLDQNLLDQFGADDLGEVFADEVETRLGFGIHDCEMRRGGWFLEQKSKDGGMVELETLSRSNG